MKLHEKIREIRRALGLSQRAFGDKLHISGSYVSEIESGKKVPADGILDMMLMKWNVSLDWWEVGEGPIFAPVNEKPQVPEHLRLLHAEIDRVALGGKSTAEQYDLTAKILKLLQEEE